MKLLALLSSVCIVLAACSQAHIPQRSRIASGERVTCRQVTPTGSHMIRTICTSAAQREQQENEGRAFLEEEQRRRAAEEAARSVATREPHVRP